MENDELNLAKDSSVTSSSVSRNEKADSSGKRSKSSHACDHCKKKKVKCNGECPCARCQKSNLYCTFNQHKQKRVLSKLYVRTQEQRIHTLEKALNALNVEPTVHSGNHTHAAQANNIANQAFMTPIEKFNTDSTGRPYYARDWSARLDRLPSTFGMMTMIDNEPRKPDAFALPETAINHNLLSTYFDHVQPYFPLIQKESFLHSINQQSPLLLNAMYAVADQWAHIDVSASNAGLNSSQSTQVAPQPPPGLKYYQDAISLVELYTDAPRLSTIQALLLIVKYHELVRRPGFFYRTRFYFDLAVRMCKDLGLPRMLLPTCQIQPILAEQRRRIFWIAYIYDLLMSTELGTPTMFMLDECNVELPSLLEGERNSREQHDTILYFHWMTMVMKAQGMVVQYLRQKYNDAPSRRQQISGDHVHLLHQHMEALGRELQLWKKPARGRVNFLFLAYHFTNTLLYRSMALDIMNGDIYLYQQMGMDHEYIKAFLLSESSAIADIVEMLLKDHTVACLHYSFRGIQQIIHYLTAAWTILLMYRQSDNDDRVKRMIQQLTPLTPVVELYSMERQKSSGATMGHTYTQQKNNDGSPISQATALATTESSQMMLKDNAHIHAVNLQHQQRLSVTSPSYLPQPCGSMPSPSSSQSDSYPHIESRQNTLTINGSETETAQRPDDTLSDNTMPSTSLWKQQKQQNRMRQNSASRYVSSTQLSSSPTPIFTSDFSSSAHSHMYIANSQRPPALNTCISALLQQSASSFSSSEPMIPTSSIGSISSTSSFSTATNTPVDTLTHGSLRLRRSHQQLRNTSYRLLSTDPRSGSPASLHHPYMSVNSANTPSALQHQHTSPRVSSGQSSPSTSSLPSSPLHRMTLADDPWIQATPVILPSDSTTPPPPPSSSSSSSSNLLLLHENHEALSDLPLSTIHQYATEQQGHRNLEEEIYNMPLLDNSLLPKTPAEEETMMGLLPPTHLDWDNLAASSTPASSRPPSPLPPT